MASMAVGMAMPVVCGPVLRMNAAKKNSKGKPRLEPKTPKKEEGKSFFDQLGEWTQKSSMIETDPLLKKVGEEKKEVVPKKEVAPKKKGLFGF